MSNLYNKYRITKQDGSPTDPNAVYFVLRLDTDRHARIALRAYARSVRPEDGDLASDLDRLVESCLPLPEPPQETK